MSQPITRAYKAILSTKHEVKLDPDEIEVVQAAIQRGLPAQVRAGIINPSYLVAIVEDRERRNLFIEDTKYDELKRLKGMAPIKDIFSEQPALPPE